MWQQRPGSRTGPIQVTSSTSLNGSIGAALPKESWGNVAARHSSPARIRRDGLDAPGPWHYSGRGQRTHWAVRVEKALTQGNP
eukprot:2073595-Amphidinium_carterae.1